MIIKQLLIIVIVSCQEALNAQASAGYSSIPAKGVRRAGEGMRKNF
jgi:hypothetical protein